MSWLPIIFCFSFSQSCKSFKYFWYFFSSISEVDIRSFFLSCAILSSLSKPFSIGLPFNVNCFIVLSVISLFLYCSIISNGSFKQKSSLISNWYFFRYTFNSSLISPNSLLSTRNLAIICSVSPIASLILVSSSLFCSTFWFNSVISLSISFNFSWYCMFSSFSSGFFISCGLFFSCLSKISWYFFRLSTINKRYWLVFFLSNRIMHSLSLSISLYTPSISIWIICDLFFTNSAKFAALPLSVLST